MSDKKSNTFDDFPMIKKRKTNFIFSFLALIATTSSLYCHSRKELREQDATEEKTSQRKETGKPTKLIKDMDFDEVSHALAYYETTEQPDLVIKCLERMLVTGGNPQTLKKARLDLAKAYEKDDKGEKALKLFQEFIQLYPGSSECEEALFKCINITFSLTSDYKHDQTKTLETIELIKQFLEVENNYAEYKELVDEVKLKCYEKLCDHDMYVCNQYITQFSYSEDEKDLNAARHRLANSRKLNLPYAPSKKEAIEQLEKKLDELNPPQPETTNEEITKQDDQSEKPDFTSMF